MSDIVFKENKDGSKITVRDVQEIIYDILVEFDRIARKHNIDYALAFGTELGAVRHNGFIPWDDDIDLWMTREEYLKLVDVLEGELNDKYYFQCYETNNKYNTLTPQMKIKVENTYIKEKTLLRNRLKKNGLFIDIFIFDHASESLFKHRSAIFVSSLLMLPIGLLDLLHIDSRPFTKLLYKHAERYAYKNRHSKYGALSVNWIFDGFKDRRLLKTDVFPSQEHIFEKQKFKISNNPHEVLKAFYGENYMTPPKASGQYPHHIVDIVIEKQEDNDENSISG